MRSLYEGIAQLNWKNLQESAAVAGTRTAIEQGCHCSPRKGGWTEDFFKDENRPGAVGNIKDESGHWTVRFKNVLDFSLDFQESGQSANDSINPNAFVTQKLTS